MHIYALCSLRFTYIFRCINTHVLIHINIHMYACICTKYFWKTTQEIPNSATLGGGEES